MGSSKVVGRAQSKPIPSSHETSTTTVPRRTPGRSSSLMKRAGRSVSCSTQFTTTSCSARNEASGTGPRSVTAWLIRSSVRSSKCTMRAVWIGAATAATSRWVSTSTSKTPRPFSADTAPRAVAPNPMTAARSLRP